MMNLKEAVDKVAIIEDFANKMGYEVCEDFYFDPEDGRPCYEILLLGTYDSAGNEYSWGWYCDTGEERTRG